MQDKEFKVFLMICFYAVVWIELLPKKNGVFGVSFLFLFGVAYQCEALKLVLFENISLSYVGVGEKE